MPKLTESEKADCTYCNKPTTQLRWWHGQRVCENYFEVERRFKYLGDLGIEYNISKKSEQKLDF